jgi:hypothetical protein
MKDPEFGIESESTVLGAPHVASWVDERTNEPKKLAKEYLFGSDVPRATVRPVKCANFEG